MTCPEQDREESRDAKRRLTEWDWARVEDPQTYLPDYTAEGNRE